MNNQKWLASGDGKYYPNQRLLLDYCKKSGTKVRHASDDMETLLYLKRFLTRRGLAPTRTQLRALEAPCARLRRVIDDLFPSTNESLKRRKKLAMAKK